ncbi:MAG: hypothetical protein WCK33_08730 [Phycisphaerae bacterium]
MRTWSVQLAAMLLLLAQTMFGVVGGKVMCIQFEHCERSGHCDAGAHDHRQSHVHPCEGSATTHELGPESHFDLLAESDGGCDCHVHLVMPVDEHVPSRSSGDFKVSAGTATSISVVMATIPRPPFARAHAEQPPPSCWATTRLRSIRMTV